MVNSFTTTARKWNKDVFGNLFSKKRSVEACLRGVQTALAYRPTDFLTDLDKKLISENAEIKCLEEEF